MNARQIIRCELKPGKFPEQFVSKESNKKPIIPRGGGVDFWFMVLDEDGAAMDISNVSDMQLIAKLSSGSWQTLGGNATLNPSCTLAQWNAGSSAHAMVTLLGTDTNLTAGQYELTVKGHTVDNAADLDCFGYAAMEVKDVGLIDSAPVSPSAATVESIVRSLMGGFVTPIRKAGQQDVLMSPNSTWRWVQGVDDTGEKIDYVEQVS